MSAPLALPLGTTAAGRPVTLAAAFANRHGLIAGATGTGKTYTLAALAESFSNIGTPVLAVDVKGDLAGICRGPAPVRHLDPFGEAGDLAPVTIAAMGPDLFARALDLSDAQRGALDIAFALHQQHGRPLATLADLRALLHHMTANARSLTARFGLVSPASVAAIQRSLLSLERDGSADALRGPAFDVAQLLDQAPDGAGVVSVLAAERLMRSPMLYAGFLTWVLGDLYERLPEVGDLERPRLVLLLDESHLLFSDAPRAIVARVERIVRLIRSKGVGVYFATQAPSDLPPAVLGQLGNRVQHGLRAATVQDQRAARAAAETLPVNPRVNAADAIASMGVGEALVSTIGADGTPQPVERVRMRRPAAQLGRVTAAERGAKPGAVALPREPGAVDAAAARLVSAVMGAGALGLWGVLAH